MVNLRNLFASHPEECFTSQIKALGFDLLHPYASPIFATERAAFADKQYLGSLQKKTPFSVPEFHVSPQGPRNEALGSVVSAAEYCGIRVVYPRSIPVNL